MELALNVVFSALSGVRQLWWMLMEGFNAWSVIFLVFIIFTAYRLIVIPLFRANMPSGGSDKARKRREEDE